MVVAACFCHSAFANTEKSKEGNPQEVPSLAFLEYLAELENVDGKWVSPLDMLDKQDSNLKYVKGAEKGNEDTLQVPHNPSTDKKLKASDSKLPGSDKTSKDSDNKEVKQ